VKRRFFRGDAAFAIPDIYEFLEAEGYKLTSTPPGCSFSINDIGAKICSTYAVLGGFPKKSIEKFLIFPQAQIVSLLHETNNLIVQIERLRNTVSPTGPNAVHFVDGSPWVIMHENGSPLLQLDREFSALDQYADHAIEISSRLLPILKLDSAANLSAISEAIAHSTQELNQIKNEAHEIVKDMNSKSEEFDESIKRSLGASHSLIESITQFVSSATRNDEETASLKSEAEGILEKIRKHLETADELSKQAAQLTGSVMTYRANFDEFDRDLSAREKLFKSGTEQIESLTSSMESEHSKLVELQKEATSVMANAKSALGWGSEAGLARSFAEAAAEQDNKLKWAERGYYISLGFMLILIAIATGLFPGADLPKFSPDSYEAPATALIILLSNVAIRLLIVLPGWLALSFTNSRYRSLMRMKEAYLFKKSIAAAIPGFKDTVAAEDTPEHAKKITATAFEQLLFNPQQSEAEKDDLDWLRKTPREVVIEALKTVREAMKLGTPTEKKNG
jgi:hypothetical protein